ncbi:MAG TPA: four helix bundle protein, partial [Gemmatimonadaceae bacterium]|nr:four helix bundle protein [Gemmatimonadaceae bacterium]
QKSMDLVVAVYEVADQLPQTERFELARQLRRAVVSVPANIAEGTGRAHLGEYIHHLYFARGSLMEVSTLLEIARRLDYLSESSLVACLEFVDHVSRMLCRLVERLEQRRPLPRAAGRRPRAGSSVS